MHNSNKWSFYESFYWHLLRSILCRALMIGYSVWLTGQAARLLGERLIYLNSFFLALIALDGFLVIRVRKGLESRWCSLSLVFFIMATATPLCLIEIVLSSVSIKNILNADYHAQIETQYRDLSIVSVNNSWSFHAARLVQTKKELLSTLGQHEVLFSLALISSRFLLPQATLTWLTVYAQIEFAFNTLFDMFSTFTLLRDARLNMPMYVWVLAFVVCYGALFPIALNVVDDESAPPKLAVSRLRKLTDCFHFRLIVQMLLVDVPFLLLRLVILANLRYVRKEMYYLLAKQVSIIVGKLAVLAIDWCRRVLNQMIQDAVESVNTGVTRTPKHLISTKIT